MNNKTIPFGIRLTPNEHLALNLLATRWGVKSSEALRKCLRNEATLAGLPSIGLLEALSPESEHEKQNDRQG